MTSGNILSIRSMDINLWIIKIKISIAESGLT